MGQLSPKTKLYTPASQGSFNDILMTPILRFCGFCLLAFRTPTVYANVLQIVDKIHFNRYTHLQ